MITLRVIRYLGRTPASPMAAHFGSAGGSLGRAPDCTLVLPDPARHVSKKQARLEPAADGMRLTCVSEANPLSVDGRLLHHGESVVLRGGESLQIGTYELQVERAGMPQGPVAATVPPSGARAMPAQSAPVDPFADLFPDATSASAPAPAGGGAPADGHGAGLPQNFDPFADLSSGSRSARGTSPPVAAPPAAHRPSSPLSSVPRPAAAGRATYASGAHSGAQRPAGSGADDPLAMLGAPSPQASDPLGLNAATEANPASPRTPASESIDALFGLDSARDPLDASSPLAAPVSAPNPSLGDDPLAALSSRPTAPSAPQVEHGSVLGSVFPIPGQASPPPAADSSPAGSGASATELIRAGAVLSWDARSEPRLPASPRPAAASPASPNGTPASPNGATALPSADTGTAPAQDSDLSGAELRSIGNRLADQRPQQFEAMPATRPTTLLDELNAEQLRALRARANEQQSPSRPAPRRASEAPTAAGDAGGIDPELLRQFLLGLGLAELPRSPTAPSKAAPTLTPELMRRIGELLRTSVQGTVELLQARALLKREMRSELTMMLGNDNNPLKFSPDALSAVAHLLSPQAVRGFLEPVPAMRDAYDDLLAHQVGFAAGMRAALQGVIERFDPGMLEERLTRRSVIDAVLPASRKARLWELFNELYAEISAEMQDDFDALFGRAFAQAYDMQIAQFERGRDGGGSGGGNDGGAL